LINAPSKTLSAFDATAIILGVVIGAGIFKTPSLVAANSASESVVMLLWLMGGLISFIGALCYAELTTTYPDSGGDYHYINRAFGYKPAFLFAWARMAVIQAGSIAMISFIVGDYATEVFSLGGQSSSWYAALIILALTAVNTVGIRQGKILQNILTSAIILGLLMIVFAGLALNSTQTANAQASFISARQSDDFRASHVWRMERSCLYLSRNQAN